VSKVLFFFGYQRFLSRASKKTLNTACPPYKTLEGGPYPPLLNLSSRPSGTS